MAISYVGGVQGGRAGATSTTTQSLSGTLTGGSNTSPSAGDLVIVLCAAGADTTAAPSQDISGNNSGAYTGLTAQSSVVATTYDTYQRVSYIIQGSTVDTSLTIPSSGSTRNAQRWVVHVFRGVDSTTPMDATATYATGTGTGRPSPAAITPVTAGAWIAAFYASAAATGTAYTAPTGFATNWLGGTTADTADCMTGAGYYTGWTSGAYDPAAITAGGTTNAADTWTATTIALRPIIDFAGTQAAFRLYADGTETGSTALANQDTNYTADVTSDFNVGLRVRIQETAGGAGASTDDYQLQYSLNSGTYYDSGLGVPSTYYFDGSDAALSDPNSAWTNDTNVDDGDTGTSASTTSWDAAGTTNYLKIEGTDAPSGTDSITLVRARVYGSNTNGRVEIYTDGLGQLLNTVVPPSSTGWGSYATLTAPSGGWTWAKIQALEAKLYQVASGTFTVARVEIDVFTNVPVLNFNSSSLTNGNATTNRLGSGTGSFVAGEITEDGLVDNLQITASNYTELLYSLTLVSSTLANNDTLDFRVLRNGATTGMTYTVTPRITASKTVGPVNATVTQVAGTLTLSGGTQTVTAGSVTSAAITQVGATLTLAGGTQVAASKQFVAISQVAATLTLTGGTQTVASKQNASVTQVAASLTLAGGTQSVSATSSVSASITQVAASLTLTGGTQSATGVSVSSASITQVAANLTLSGGTQTLSAVRNAAITQVAGTLSLTGGTQAVASKVSSSVSQVAANLTLTGGAQVIASKQIASVSQVAGTLTLSGGTQTVASVQNSAVSQVKADLTLTGGTQAISATQIVNASVTQVYAQLSLTGGTQSVSTVSISNASVTQVAGTLNLTVGTQTVASVQNASITQVSANLTLSGGTQVVASSRYAAITQAKADLTLSGGTQTVASVRNATVTQVKADLTLSGGTQSISTVNIVAISQVSASLSLTGGTQSLGSVINASVAQESASLTLSGGTQAISATVLSNASVTQVSKALNITGGSQTISTVQNTSVTQVYGTLELTGGTQGVTIGTGSVVDASVAQVAAPLSLTGGTQEVATANYASIEQVYASVIITGGTPSVSAVNNVYISQVSASLILTPQIPTISANSPQQQTIITRTLLGVGI